MRKNLRLVAGLAACLAACLAAPAGVASAAGPVKEVNHSAPLPADGRVTIETFKGTLHVSTWERAEVSLKARIEPDEPCSDDARRIADTDVDFDAAAGKVSIRSNYDKLKSHSSWVSSFLHPGCGSLPLVHYEISLPKTAALRIKDHKSRIDLAGLTGDLRLETYKGTATLRDVEGTLDLETYKGELRISTALRKETRIDTYKGDVLLTLPKGAGFDLDARIQRRGHLESDFAAASSRRRSREERTRGAVNGGGPLLKLSTYKGEIRLRSS